MKTKTLEKIKECADGIFLGLLGAVGLAALCLIGYGFAAAILAAITWSWTGSTTLSLLASTFLTIAGIAIAVEVELDKRKIAEIDVKYKTTMAEIKGE